MDAECQPSLSLAAHLLPQHTMMILQILIQILKLRVNKNAVLVRLVHRWSNKQYAGQACNRFHSHIILERWCCIVLILRSITWPPCPQAMTDHLRGRSGPLRQFQIIQIQSTRRPDVGQIGVGDGTVGPVVMSA